VADRRTTVCDKLPPRGRQRPEHGRTQPGGLLACLFLVSVDIGDPISLRRQSCDWTSWSSVARAERRVETSEYTMV
jgi:hypothetical protein